MVGGSDFNILNRRSSSNSTTGGRKMLRTTGFDSLPDDILMQILVRIPAQDIVDSTNFVCRKWHEITLTRDFAYAHLHHSTPGLLFQNFYDVKPATFMLLAHDEGNHQVQMSDFIFISRDRYNCTSCNGLILEPKVNYELMIRNPVRRHCFDLPPFISKTIYPTYTSAIGHVATRKEYKVVRAYYTVNTYTGGADLSRVHCAILTVGVDNSWRLVDTQHLSPKESKKLTNWCRLVTEGFVHWVPNFGSYSNHILSLNMETEVLSQIPAPRYNGLNNYSYKYLSTAVSSLSLLIGVGRLKWEVWEMKPSETGEYCWTKLPDIDLEAHRALLNELFEPAGDEDADCLECFLSPSGWLKYREVIAFVACNPSSLGCPFRLHVAYNVETKDVFLYETDYAPRSPLVHRNSLVRIC